MEQDIGVAEGESADCSYMQAEMEVDSIVQ